MRFTVLVLALLLAATSPAAAGAGPVALGDRNLRLAHQTLGPDESELPATDVLQDQAGFVWIGTDEGLFRLSGTKVVAFTHSRSDPLTLTDDTVVDLHLDGDGALWVATASGLHRYNRAGEYFERYLSPDIAQLQGATLTVVHSDASGTLWLGTRNAGLFAIPGANQVRHFRAPEDGSAHLSGGLPNNHITTLLSDSKNNLWIGTDGGGLVRFDRRTETFVSYQQVNSGISSDRITQLYEDPKGRLWIGTADAGLLQFDPDMQSFSSYRHDPQIPKSLSSDHVTDMLTDRLGSFWVATDNGLNELESNNAFARYLAEPSSATGLRSNALRRLHLDADGVLWIATAKGLDRWNYLSDAFSYLGQGSEALRVSSATECADGQLWIGTRDQGLAYLDRASGRLHPVAGQPQQIRALLCDVRGTLWVGSVDQGLSRAVPGTSPANTTLQPIAAAAAFKNVSALVMDSSGTLWAGTPDQGLLALRPVPSTSREAQPTDAFSLLHFASDPTDATSLPDDRVRTLFLDDQQQLWIGLDNGTLARLALSTDPASPQQHSFETFALTTDSGRRAATDLLQSKNGDLWITTNGAGLLRWPAEQLARGETRFTQFTKASGLPSDHLRALLEDQSGQLWISGTRGLVRFDPATLKMRRFDSRNGLRGDRFFSASKLISRSGQLFFGGQQGLAGFYPSAIGQLKTAPRVTLSAHSRSARLTRTFSGEQTPPPIPLNAGTDFIEFQFSALQYIAPEQNRYQYQLQGFDAQWHEPDAALTATYTGLPAGDYLFRVRAANPDGVWSEANAQLALEIAPPLAQSTAAYATYGLLLVLLCGYLLFSWHREVERLRTSRRTLEIQVEHRTTELEERNRQLQELNLKLQEASITDPLTGLLNRRSFYEFVSREVARVERSYTSSSSDGSKRLPALDDPNRRLLFFMMIDLDAFKPINDTFGHHTGDHTLVQVSDLLRACARDADTVFRWGGDEFLVIGQVNTEGDMELLAERFRKAIAEHRFDPKYGKALRLSASIGVAPYPFSAANPGIAAWEQVADVADLAAYLAKTHGKNAWVSTRGSDELTAMQMQRVKDNFELLIETRKIFARSSETHIPIPGASRTE